MTVYVETAVYTTPEHDWVEVTMNNGRQTVTPYPSDTQVQRYLDEFIRQGGTIQPYVEPESVEEDLPALQSQLDVVITQLRALENRVARLEAGNRRNKKGTVRR